MTDEKRVCPVCAQEYSGSERFCIADGAELLDSPAGESPRAANPWWSRVPKETIVGLGIVAFLGLVVACILLIRQTAQFRVYVLLKQGYKLEVGNNVYVQGSKAGAVDAIDRAPSHPGFQFLATVHIEHKFRELVTTNSRFQVWPDQFLTGKNCITVTTDASSGGQPLANGQTVEGFGPVQGTIKRARDWLKQKTGI